MPALYPTLAVAAAVAVIALERWYFRSGIFRSGAYWISMTIVYLFMVPVDGWLSKLSAPIVIFNDAHTSGWRPIWDILAEEFVYAFALLTLIILCWDRAGAEDERTNDTSSVEPHRSSDDDRDPVRADAARTARR